MQPFHAVVKNGRLVLDQPTDLPDGHVVVMVPLEELLEFAADEAAENGEPVSEPPAMSFVLAPREWKKPAPVDARSLIEELRAM